MIPKLSQWDKGERLGYESIPTAYGPTGTIHQLMDKEGARIYTKVKINSMRNNRHEVKIGAAALICYNSSFDLHRVLPLSQLSVENSCPGSKVMLARKLAELRIGLQDTPVRWGKDRSTGYRKTWQSHAHTQGEERHKTKILLMAK